jgi:taurine--2-oxoglutarate transaminase
VVAAIKEQADKLCFIAPSFANEARSRLAKRIAEVTPGDLTKTFFTLGGAEANENALKIARSFTGRQKIIGRYRSYHGATMGSITLSGDRRRWPTEPGIPGVLHAFDPYCYRCTFGQELESCNLECVSHIEELIWYEGPEEIAGIFIEPVPGANGIVVPPDKYMPALRELCDKYDILLIVDEVMTGFGRTGEWFSVDNWNVVPDILTFAKGATSGYLPLGGVVVSSKIADHFEDHMLWCGLTFSGHPMSCAAALATIEVYEQENLIENSKRMGSLVLQELQNMADRHPSVGDVRGVGLFCGVELVKDRETREPLVRWNAPSTKLTDQIRSAAMERGMYILGRWNVFEVAPPLIATEKEINEGIGILDEVLEIADAAL